MSIDQPNHSAFASIFGGNPPPSHPVTKQNQKAEEGEFGEGRENTLGGTMIDEEHPMTLTKPIVAKPAKIMAKKTVAKMVKKVKAAKPAKKAMKKAKPAKKVMKAKAKKPVKVMKKKLVKKAKPAKKKPMKAKPKKAASKKKRR